MCVYLCAKFQVFNIILTSFRRGSFTSSHPPSPPNNNKKKTNEKTNPEKAHPDKGQEFYPIRNQTLKAIENSDIENSCWKYLYVNVLCK